jgi:hypothetical protein
LEENAKTIASTGVPTKNHCSQLDLMIVTNDMTFFGDTDDGSHKRALSRFYDNVQPFFRDGTLQSIHIVVIKTGKIALAPLTEPKNDRHADGYVVREGEISSTDDSARNECTDLVEVDARHAHGVAISKCIRAMKTQLTTRVEADLQLHCTSSYDKPVRPMNIAISELDATANPRLAFQSLQERCLRDMMASVRALLFGCSPAVFSATHKNRLRFDLPETIVGSQCSIALEVSYRIVPCALDQQSLTPAFFRDLEALCMSKLEIVQLIPIDCLDAGLLFGVPIQVRAGFELCDDFDRYQEALALVSALFKSMVARQAALLLRISENQATNAPVGGVFHYPRRGQLFVLMADEPIGAPPSTATLHRYASADEILMKFEKPVETPSLPEETRKQYESYVENALDMIDCHAVNPLHLDAMTNPPLSKKRRLEESPLSPLLTSEANSIWNDNTGVGALQRTEDEEDCSGMGADADDGSALFVSFEYE